MSEVGAYLLHPRRRNPKVLMPPICVVVLCIAAQSFSLLAPHDLAERSFLSFLLAF